MIIKNDRHFYPVEILSGDRLKVDNTEVTLQPGIYYTHQDSTLHSSGYPSLYIMIATRLNAVLGGTWKFFPIRPADYKLRTGVRLTKLTGTAPVDIDFSETTNIVQRVMGFSGNESGVKVFVDRNLDGEFAAYGSWSPYSFFEGRADSKDSWMERVTNWSSTHPEVAKAVVWRERRNRLLTYSYVFGAYINQNRAEFDQLSEQAGMATDDFNNSLENLWLVHGRNLGSIIVVYDMDDLDLNVTTWNYEIVKFASINQAQAMDNIATRTTVAADVWNVRLIYTVLGGNGYGL